MRTVTEPARQIPVFRQCDVLVVGGGPAGIAAAIGAARAGADTVLVERYGCLGGILTISAMETPAWWRDKAAVMPGGIFEEMESRLVDAGLTQPSFFRPTTALAYDTEALKYIADDMVEESGALAILQCIGVSPLMEGPKITGVVTESKGGRQAILASRVVDCTGDADIAARAGVAYGTSDEERTGFLPAGSPMGGTVVYGLTGVDTKRLEDDVNKDPTSRHPITHKLCYRYFSQSQDEGVPQPEGLKPSFVYNMVEKDALPAINQTRAEVDGTDVRSLTDGEILCRQAIMEGIPILRRYCPGMENARLRTFAMGIGVRETRRIVGEYTLGLHDIYENRACTDSIGVYPFCSDGPEGTIPASTDRHFQVPFRITVPKSVENLLVAGRCVSARRRCTSVSRMVNFAMVTGQATGIASAIAARQGILSRQTPVAELQAELGRQGVRVG